MSWLQGELAKGRFVIVCTRSAAETRQVGAELAERLRPNGVALLFGDLGSGKTVLTQGVAQGLGFDPEAVQSPTFTLMHEHALHHARDPSVPEREGGPPRLCHVDLYRLEPEEVEGIGLEEALAQDGVKVIEWADRLPFRLPAVEVRLAVGRRPGERTIEILEAVRSEAS